MVSRKGISGIRLMCPFCSIKPRNQRAYSHTQKKLNVLYKGILSFFCIVFFLLHSQRIMDSAEQAALSESDPESATSKAHPSAFYDARRINEYQSDGRLAEGSRQMLLRHMRRFEGYPVNISLSSVLLPAGVSLDDPETQSAIKWSSHLDPLFANNIERDSALSWQYFGSSTGFLRRFPGTAWPPETSYGSKEINDFRSEDWFIQAASSPKDVVRSGATCSRRTINTKVGGTCSEC